jgi:hypothetical protein
MKNICDYFGCDEPICDADKEYNPPSLMFCVNHSNEVDMYIEDHNIPELLAFWVRAGGGAKRMAGTK